MIDKLYEFDWFRIPTDWILANVPAWVVIAIVVHFAVLGAVAYLILLERKTASWVQDRIGPNRVGLGGLVPLLLIPLAPFVNIDPIIEKARGFHMFGLGQPLADGLKFIVKEDYRPKHVDKILFSLAPIIMITVIIISIATLPLGGVHRATRTLDMHGIRPDQYGAMLYEKLPSNARNIQTLDTNLQAETATVQYDWSFQIANLNIGVLFILAALSLAVYGVVIGGWASNNKYSFLGGLRATANMISYEIPLGLAVLAIVVMFGTLELDKIVNMQAHYWFGIIPAWNVFTQPLAFMMFLICIHAEANRAPFDLAEAEQELVGGYHTEYSAMRFALFFLAEYAGMITTSAVCVALFFGGWQIPWIDKLDWFKHNQPLYAHPEITTSLIICVLRALVFFGKTIGIIFVFMWVRWSLPRFRFDQLMMLAWRALIPMSLGILVMTALVVYATHGQSFYSDDSHFLNGKTAVIFLASNVLLLLIMLVVSTLLPAAPETNRKMPVPGSRYAKTPLPAVA